MISISGLNSNVALRLIDSTRDRQIDVLRGDPFHSRAEDAFRERIGQITTPEELVQDFEVYSFVMRAFDLEDRIFGRGMMRKILESNPEDDTSLVNRLSDRRFRVIHEELGFTNGGGPVAPTFDDPAWIDSVVDRYFDRVFANGTAAQNPTVGTVLEFEEKAGTLNTWFHVLADEELSEFFRTALSLPREMALLEVDDQVRRLEERFDLESLSDPAVREDLIGRYVAISDVLNPPARATSPIVSMLQPIGSRPQIIPLTLNFDPVLNTSSIASLYR